MNKTSDHLVDHNCLQGSDTDNNDTHIYGNKLFRHPSHNCPETTVQCNNR